MPDQSDPLLLPSEVAKALRVSPKTVTRWAKTGQLASVRTLGGHRRFRASEVKRAVDDANGEGGA